MKDATGELSMTAVAVVAIALISVLFSQVIWPIIKGNITRSTYCAQAFSCDCGDGSTCTCSYCADDACSTTKTVSCPASSVSSSETKTK